MGHSACLIAVSTTPYRLHDHAVGRPPAGPFPRVVVMGCGDAEQALDTVAAPHQAMEVVAMRRWWRRPAKLVVRFPRFFGGWVIWRRLARVER